VVVGLSGGVDSSVAALLLKQQGWKVIGLFMKNWEDDDTDEYCSSRQDLIDVMSVADVIGIDVEVVNFAKPNTGARVSIFLANTRPGARRIRTCCAIPRSSSRPSSTTPCSWAPTRSPPATTPGARIQWRIPVAQGRGRHQGPELFPASPEPGAAVEDLFPLAALQARRAQDGRGGRPARGVKKDSTGICFIGERPFKEFLMRYLPPKKGEIRCLDDERVLGEHDGLTFHTIGQRKGLHIGGMKNYAKDGEHDAWFVAARTWRSNVLYVVQGHDHPALLRRRAGRRQLSWVSGERPHTHWVYTAKTRYRQPMRRARSSASTPTRAEINFAEPQWAVTPGQSVVVYESRVCLGGSGVPSRILKSCPVSSAPSLATPPVKRSIQAMSR
jgi:tRNA-specific 2-thiouridylase